MVTILTPWAKRAAAPDKRVRLNQDNPLAQGLVFAWSGHQGLDVVSGIRPTFTNVTPSTVQYGRSWSFAGGAEGNSEINFGPYLPTANLHDSPATWAFLVKDTGAISGTALACHTDANNDRGWSVGWHDDSSFPGLGVVMVRATANLRKVTTTQPADHTSYALVITYEGGNTASSIRIYLDGRLATMPTGQDGSGSTGVASSESLYLGRRRFDDPLSSNATVALGLIANRVWSDAEVSDFYLNPWQMFEESRSHGVFSLPSLLEEGVLDVATFRKENPFLD